MANCYLHIPYQIRVNVQIFRHRQSVYMKLEVSDHEIMTHDKLNLVYEFLVVIFFRIKH